MIRRRLRRSELAALALATAAFALAGCGGGEGREGEVTADQPAADPPAPAVGENGDGGGDRGDGGDTGVSPAEAAEQPSKFARKTIPRRLLRLYLGTGRQLTLGWWLIAAVDQIDLKDGDPGIPPAERIPGIGYSLAAAGAPHDNHAALAARAGGAYAERVLDFASKLVREPEDVELEGSAADSGHDH